MDMEYFQCYYSFQHMLKTGAKVKTDAVVRQRLIETLSTVPAIRVKSQEGPTAGADLIIRLRNPGGPSALICEYKSSGQPRFARQAINQLLRHRDINSGAYPVFLAPYISPETAAICVGEGVGYQDLAGNCRLSFGPIYIERHGFPNPAVQRRELRSLYSPKAERVLRVLLSNPARRWKTQALARGAEVSLGQISNVKRLLSDREWIESSPEGFRLSRPEPLVREWSSQYRQRSRAHELFSLKSESEMELELRRAGKDLGAECALTQFSAAAHLAPYVRGQRTTAYWSGDVQAVIRALQFKPVPSGANVLLLEPYDEGVFYGAAEMDGVLVVSPVQAYLDLQGAGLRSEEAAAELLEHVLRRQW